MLYLIILFVTLLAVVCCIIIDSISYYLRLKNELVDALTEVCVNQDSDPKLLTILVEHRIALNDEQLLSQIKGWLKSGERHRSLETWNVLEKQYAKMWMSEAH